jgi:hypothetical protein
MPRADGGLSQAVAARKSPNLYDPAATGNGFEARREGAETGSKAEMLREVNVRTDGC